MEHFVLDASVAVAWIVPHVEQELPNSVRERLLAGDRALVPPIWILEVVSAMKRAIRRGMVTQAMAENGLQQLSRLFTGSPRIAIADGFTRVHDAYQMTLEHEVSVYDGCYLDLAMRERMRLATIDEGLRRAAEQAGVGLI